MTGPGPHSTEIHAIDAQSPRLAAEDPRQHLPECASMFFDPLCNAVHASVNGTNDLFDAIEGVQAHEVATFRAGRSRWVDEFERVLREGYETRIAGRGRHERRPDGEGTHAGIQLMEPAEQETQMILVEAIRNFHRATRLEVLALNRRIPLVLGETGRPDLDNPFGPPYVLDAIGSPARALYTSPYTWRALMARVIADVTPVLYRIYVSQNRFLADRDVLPDIKAWLRNRSQYRPTADRELVPTFRRLQSVARTHGGLARPIKISELALAPDAPPSEPDGHPPRAPPLRAAEPAAAPPAPSTAPTSSLSDAEIQSALAALLARPSDVAAQPMAPLYSPYDPDNLPAVDTGVASTVAQDPALAALMHFAQSDLRFAIVSELAARGGAAAELSSIPQNLIPHLRALLATRASTPESLAAIDLVERLFEYIFSDPAIPVALHSVFERLQLPVLRVALFDATFFAEIDHPMRKLMNDLADAAVGATEDAPYLARLMGVAGDIAQKTCTAHHLDYASLDGVATILRRFIAEERRRTIQAIAADVAAAIAAERRDLARSKAMQAIRRKLAGQGPPPQIRKFAETVWVDHLAATIRRGDPDGTIVSSALRTLDDLLWSVTPKEELADKKRLRERVPSLVTELRQGCAAARLPQEQIDAFISDLYQYHAAEVKTVPQGPLERTKRAVRAPKGAPEEAEPTRIGDFVVELILGTWVRFNTGGKSVLMRLYWASVMREHYVFAGRAAGRGRVLTPEELVRELGNGGAKVVIEPIPLFERAIDAAFDAIGSGASRNFRYTDAGGAGVQRTR